MIGIIANASATYVPNSARVNHLVKSIAFLGFRVSRVVFTEDVLKRVPLSEAEAVDHSARVGIDDQHDFVPLVVVLREPHWSVKQLHVPDV